MTLEMSAELRALGRLVTAVPRVRPIDEPDGSPRPGTGWLPGVATGKAALDDPAGWYQHSIAATSGGLGVRAMSLAVQNLSPIERAETQVFTRHTLNSTDARIRPFRLPADSYTFAPATWSVFVKADQHVVTHAGVLY